MNNIYKAIDPVHVAKVAGSGNKFVHLLDNKADCYLNLVPGFKFWDMCASDALIKSRHGFCTNADSKPLIYDETKTNYTVRDGIVVAKNKKVFEVM